MEKSITRFSLAQLTQLTQHRSGEVKFGEKVQVVPDGMPIEEFLETSDALFVLIGIPEDIGVRANFGRGGTHVAWQNSLKSLVNMQHNKFCKAQNILILGEVNVVDAMTEAETLDPTNKENRKRMFELVEQIDKEVSHVIRKIVQHKKTPIVVGGGHNNAYGIIKGVALAKGKAINTINFDAHTDFRIMEGRHSGNGFNYAFDEGFLKKYYIFGLHENYVSKSVFKTIKELKESVKYATYEEIAIKRTKPFDSELGVALQFISDAPFGIEIDLDAIENTPSSAMTPSGFSAENARQFVYHFAQNPQATYLHICEGNPIVTDDKNPQLVGKLVAYLLTDFIKAKGV